MGSLTVDAIGSCSYDYRRFQLRCGHFREVETLGGSGWLMARAARRLGASVRLISPFGDNEHGRRLRELIESRGIQTIDAGVSNSRCCFFRTTVSRELDVEVLELGQPLQWCSAKSATQFDSDPDLRLVGHVPLNIMEMAVRRGQPECMVMNPSGALREFPPVWELVKNVAKVRSRTITSLNIHELSMVDPLARIESLLPAQAVLIVTYGALGVKCAYEHAVLWHPSRAKNSSLNPVGAGDTLVTTVAVSLLEGLNLERSLSLGSEAATWSMASMWSA